MTKSTTASSPGYRLCPTCGTRVGAAATKCLVCGADLTVTGGQAPARPGQGTPLNRRPISLLTVLVILVVVALLGVGGVMLATASGLTEEFFNPSTETPSATVTATPTLTLTPTPTETLEPTGTPLPPVDYQIKSGDTCILIALNFNVSVNSIILANGGLINADCSNLSVGAIIKVPQPTPTPSPLPSATLSDILNTPVPRATYVVRDGDTLQGIARFYGLQIGDVMEANSITDPSRIRSGQVLVIPLELAITPGPTATATQPPPYPAPQQLSPRDGEPFVGVETITLQWVAVSPLRPGEQYQVTIEDVTANAARILRDVVPDTKFIILATFQPQDGAPHIYRWSVTTVRERPGADPAQPPAYDPAGLSSPERTFTWTRPGGAAPASP
jgi:LysM repeat protein